MLRAGLSKLKILEEGFTDFDKNKHPKMLINIYVVVPLRSTSSYHLLERLEKKHYILCQIKEQQQKKCWNTI
jgi:hypothetical protein